MLSMLRGLAGELPTLADHAEAYADLAADELAAAARQWKLRAVALGLCVVATIFAAGFGGVALMLWGALPTAAAGPAPWLLWALPLACALAAGAAAWAAHTLPRSPAFAELRSQWRQDMAVVRGDAAP